MRYLEDHGLPLVQLKERRHKLVVSLGGHQGPISNVEIAEIASLQQAIAAMEAVIDDLDSTIKFSPQPQRQSTLPTRAVRKRTTGNIELVFGRRPRADLRYA